MRGRGRRKAGGRVREARSSSKPQDPRISIWRLTKPRVMTDEDLTFNLCRGTSGRCSHAAERFVRHGQPIRRGVGGGRLVMRHFVDQEMTKSPACPDDYLYAPCSNVAVDIPNSPRHLFPFPSHHVIEPPDRHFDHAQRYIRPPSRLFATRPPSPRRPFLHAGRVQ